MFGMIIIAIIVGLIIIILLKYREKGEMDEVEGMCWAAVIIETIGLMAAFACYITGH